MKILTCSQQKEADAYTITNEAIPSIKLMEKAAIQITEAICKRWDSTHSFTVFAGPGNNGGDAVAVTRLLFLKGYNVTLYVFNVSSQLSEECQINIQRLQECKFPNFNEVYSTFNFPKLKEGDIVIDGLFGSGLNKPLSGGFAAIVQRINASPATIVSIDIPSGLMGENNSNNIRQNIIRADLTLCVHAPKLSFLFLENEEFVGEWENIDIGISKDFINQVNTPYHITERNDVCKLIKPRKRFAHKGNFGHGLLIAGSYGMAGAAVLSAKAGLRSGIGLLTIHTPICNHFILQTAVPEAIVQDDVFDRYFAAPTEISRFQAIAIGPGIGQEEDTALATLEQIKTCPIPLVLDADALNIFSTYQEQLDLIPPLSILTPHVRELERIIGRCNNSYERLTKAIELAARLQCFIILKGAWTAVITPDGDCYFNPTGNPGMATGGSGDVLTGILMSLLAQGYSQEEACRLGVYVHGLAGDIAAQRLGEISMTAGDIVEALPEAWKSLTIS